MRLLRVSTGVAKVWFAKISTKYKQTHSCLYTFKAIGKPIVVRMRIECLSFGLVVVVFVIQNTTDF